jgi:hypothetical protein
VIYQGIDVEIGPLDLARVASAPTSCSTTIQPWYHPTLEAGPPAADSRTPDGSSDSMPTTRDEGFDGAPCDAHRRRRRPWRHRAPGTGGPTARGAVAVLITFAGRPARLVVSRELLPAGLVTGALRSAVVAHVAVRAPRPTPIR